jgi:hypothetical protein
MICFPLHIDYYIPLLDVILIIRCMCHMLAERHVVVPLWRSVCMFSNKKNKKKHGLSQQMVSEQLVLWFVRKAERENLGLCQSLIITKEP